MEKIFTNLHMLKNSLPNSLREELKKRGFKKYIILATLKYKDINLYLELLSNSEIDYNRKGYGRYIKSNFERFSIGFNSKIEDFINTSERGFYESMKNQGIDGNNLGRCYDSMNEEIREVLEVEDCFNFETYEMTLREYIERQLEFIAIK